MNRPEILSTMDNAVTLTERLSRVTFPDVWGVYHMGESFIIENECGLLDDSPEWNTEYIPFRVMFPIDGVMNDFTVEVINGEESPIDPDEVRVYVTHLLSMAIIQLAIDRSEGF